jgi:hypothetical protein
MKESAAERLVQTDYATLEIKMLALSEDPRMQLGKNCPANLERPIYIGLTNPRTTP